MEAASGRMAAEDGSFLNLDGRAAGHLAGHAGLGRAFRLVRWTGDGRCREACNAAYEKVGGCFCLREERRAGPPFQLRGTLH